MKKTTIPEKEESADENKPTDDESDEKIPRGTSASHDDLVNVLEVAFLGFAKGDREPLFCLLWGLAAVGRHNL